jgi:hypothetical protein
LDTQSSHFNIKASRTSHKNLPKLFGSVSLGGASMGSLAEIKSISTGKAGGRLNRYIKKEADKRYAIIKEK